MNGARREALCRLAVLSAVALGADPARANETPVGDWVTIDDETGRAKSVVRITRRGDRLAGRVVSIVDPAKKDARCTDCKGQRRGQRVLGMEIVWGLQQKDDEWTGGTILDPRNGKEYSCTIRVLDGGARLEVRGYIGIELLGRTQYWRRSGRGTS